MSGWVLATLGAAALGSVFPVLNTELYLIGVLTTVEGPSWWVLALAATVGQLAGKTLFFLAGRGSVTLGDRLSRMTRVSRNGRWSRTLHKFHEHCRHRPGLAVGMLLLGAVTGVPPFTVMCFVSGAAGLSWTWFLTLGFVGRAAHFLLVAGAPELLRQTPLL